MNLFLFSQRYVDEWFIIFYNNLLVDSISFKIKIYLQREFLFPDNKNPTWFLINELTIDLTY